MGLVAKLLSFTRVTISSDLKVDVGGLFTKTVQHFSSPGDDAHPLPGDFVQIVPQAGSGRASAVGYVDPKNEQKALSGEKRGYARDANGDSICEVWLKNDGSVTSTNANGSFVLNADGSMKGLNAGSFELTAAGDFIINGVTIDTSGNITTPTAITAASVVANGKELAGHLHPAGTFPGDTGVNT